MPSNWGEETFRETGCSELINNEHILRCSIVHENQTYDINHIHNGNNEEKLQVLNIFKRNTNRRKMYLPLDSEYQIF